MMQSSIFGNQLPQKLSRALQQHASEYYNDCNIEELRRELQAYLKKLEGALAHNEFLDINTAKQMVGVFNNLLDQFDTFSNKEKALIFGSIQYFVQDRDAHPDTKSVLGLDDDVFVLNYVLVEIGRPELLVEL
jgi:uncharacterized membrane protein YkvA (DUF1232 family)